MRSPKWLTIITFVISATSLIGTILLHSKEQMLLIYNISLALFGSAVLGFIMSLTEYFAVKRKAMELFYEEAIQAIILIGKANYYFDDDDSNKVEKLIDYYIELHNKNWTNLKNAYGNLDFIFSNRSLRKWTYESIYIPIIHFKKSIGVPAWHFQLYKSGEGNIAVCKTLLQEMNKNWFVAKEIKDENSHTITVYRKHYNDLSNAVEHFRCKIYGQFFEPEELTPYTAKTRTVKSL
ncbi:hypothetical protein J2Z32_001707 [Paenibacillus turicensis]|uniref:Uncharacterized protein n=1 Tax=Paenibacillus turicensis TaxID=160487 RepID=A0ABS4FR79_9BACL|nr:hypothetical protein [Paenibacillus turicensis]MBP1905082.1 hypothetical protein [Paenibacillus turicensis]